MMQSEQINEIAKALAAAQAEIEDPHKTRTGKIKGVSRSGKEYEYEYKYADIADVLKNVRAALSHHSISVTQPTIVDGNTLIVRTQLSHESGQWFCSDYPVCSIQGDHQKMGAAMSYARRYALTSMVGVAADEDKDGEGAAEPAPKQRRSSAQAKRDGGLNDLHADLIDVHSAVSLDRLQKHYQANVYPTWPKGWAEAADMQFDAKLAEFTASDLTQALRDSVELETGRQSDSIESKADYIRYAHNFIEAAQSDDELKEWYRAEAPARTRYRLTREEAKAILDRMKDRHDELEVTDAPRGRDVAGQPVSILDGG